MASTYIKKLLETVQADPSRSVSFVDGIIAGDTTLVTGASGAAISAYKLTILAVNDVNADATIQIKDGADVKFERIVPAKAQADFDIDLQSCPWKLADGADLVLNSDTLFVKCNATVFYDMP